MATNQPLRLLGPRDRRTLAAAARRRAAQLRDEAQRDLVTSLANALRHAWAALRGAASPTRC